MVTLILVFCAFGNSQTCKEIRPDLVGYGTLIECMRQGQMVAAQALQTEPGLHGYGLSRVRCEWGIPRQSSL